MSLAWLLDDTIQPTWAKQMEARINKQIGTLMSEAQDAIDAVSAQLGKAKDEILAKVADLEAQIAAGETPDLTALKAAAQALDDVVPDAPAPEPTPEPPV